MGKRDSARGGREGIDGRGDGEGGVGVRRTQYHVSCWLARTDVILSSLDNITHDLPVMLR